MPRRRVVPPGFAAPGDRRTHVRSIGICTSFEMKREGLAACTLDIARFSGGRLAYIALKKLGPASPVSFNFDIHGNSWARSNYLGLQVCWA